MSAAAAAPPLLAIDRLSVSIDGAPILDEVSLTLAAGEVLGLVGASGSGKSMLALAVLKLLPRRSRLQGSVRLVGVELTGLTDAELCRVRGRDVGMVFQEPMTALNPLMTVVNQVAETIRLHERVSARAARLRALEALERVGLGAVPGIERRHAHELSGGQRQRVAIALAIAAGPRLLIADEPTTALDVITQAEVLELLTDLVRSSGMGMILVTHDMGVVARTAERIAVMQGGRILEQADRAQLQALAAPYSRALLAAAQLEEGPPVRSAPIRHGGDAPATLLEVRDVVREYRRRSAWRRALPLRAVDRVSLTIRAGEAVGLVGASGSGKSSLVRMILGLDAPTSGEVRVGGASWSAARGPALRGLRRRVQAVFQDPYGSFDPEWTVERLVAEPFAVLDRAPRGTLRLERVAHALEQVGLSAADAARYPHEFSGGERQRIAIARALINEPDLIVFDEAVSALDVLVRARILALLSELQARRGLSFLFVTHDLGVVRRLTERLYVMHGGRIVEEGGTLDVFRRPQDAYTAALLAATPRIEDPGFGATPGAPPTVSAAEPR